jgi:hypothetical protein
VRIAFIANYEKTIVFFRIAQTLGLRGHLTYWISPSHHWAEWLIGQGVPRDQVLDIAAHGPEWRGGLVTPSQLAELHVLEERSGVTVKNLILMDRILRRKPSSRVLAYFATAQALIRAFLATRRIVAVFGEQTFGVEILAGMVCRALGIEMLAPHPVRIPAGRMGFFRGHLQAELASIRAVSEADRKDAERFLDDFRLSRPRPHYFFRNRHFPAPRWAWPRKLAKHVRLALTDPWDETHFSPMWLTARRTREFVNASMHRLTRPFSAPAMPPARPFVLFALHKQPESSIDVLGAMFSNQAELIRSLVRSLPATHDLYVKEHGNALGDRSWAELRALRGLPGVVLVDPGVDTFTLMEHAALTITVSGTVAYEAGLLGRPAATIARMFFGPVLSINGLNPYADALTWILAAGPRGPSSERAVELLAWVFAQSFPGIVDNPNFTPECLDTDNLLSVAAGFADLLGGGLAGPRA